MSQEQAPHKEQNTFRCAYATSRGTVLSKRPSQVRKINGMVQDQYFSLAVSSLGLIQVTAFRKQLFFPICILMPLAPEIPVTESDQNIVIKKKNTQKLHLSYSPGLQTIPMLRNRIQAGGRNMLHQHLTRLPHRGKQVHFSGSQCTLHASWQTQDFSQLKLITCSPTTHLLPAPAGSSAHSVKC